MRKLLVLSTLVAGGVWAAERPALTGVWRLDPARCAFADNRLKSQSLSISQEDESIKFKETTTEESGKETKLEFECNTNGRACDVKLNGQATQLSAYYNGAILVMIEQHRGSDSAIKKRLKTSEDGKTLTIEIANLAKPEQKPDSLVYAKEPSAGQ